MFASAVNVAITNSATLGDAREPAFFWAMDRAETIWLGGRRISSSESQRREARRPSRRGTDKTGARH